MNTTRILVSLLLLGVLLSDRMMAQTSSMSGAATILRRGLRFGLFGSADILFHHADFAMLPGAPSCCPQYTGGSGGGFSVGLMAEYPYDARWMFGGRIAYEGVNASFRDREPTTFIVAGKATDGAFEHQLDARYGTVTVEPTIAYMVADSILGTMSFYVHMGAGFGIKAITDFTQRERIVEPEGIGLYTENGSDTRNEYTGSIPEATPLMADLRLGLSLDLPVNVAGTFLISPELWYSLGLTPVVRTVDWNVHALRIGLAVRYAPIP
jgi:hypothetical protein